MNNHKEQLDVVRSTVETIVDDIQSATTLEEMESLNELITTVGYLWRRVKTLRDFDYQAVLTRDKNLSLTELLTAQHIYKNQLKIVQQLTNCDEHQAGFFLHTYAKNGVSAEKVIEYFLGKLPSVQVGQK